MEHEFFQHIVSGNLRKAKHIYESYHVDVMFNRNCVIYHAVAAKKMNIIKWLITIQDYDDFLMSIACRYKYFELIEYLYARFNVVCSYDIDAFVADCRDSSLVTTFLSTYLNTENFYNGSINYAVNEDIIGIMMGFGYIINVDVIKRSLINPVTKCSELLNNNITLEYAHKKGLIDEELAVTIMTDACTRDKQKTLQYFHDNFLSVVIDDCIYENLDNDPIACMEYMYEMNIGISILSTTKVQFIVNTAMQHRAHRVVKFIIKKTGVKPTVFSDNRSNFEYTRLLMKLFPSSPFSPRHLLCDHRKLFKLVLSHMTLTQHNIDDCVTNMLFVTDPMHMKCFLSKLFECNNHIVTLQHKGNLFVYCCMANFLDSAKRLWENYGNRVSYSNLYKNAIYQETLTDDTIINTPRRLLATILENDQLVETAAWVADIFNITLKYTHVSNAIEVGFNPKTITFLVQNVELSPTQLKHVFTSILINYDNPYYLCKYLKSRYLYMMTPHFQSVLFKYAAFDTLQTFTLFENNDSSPCTSLSNAVHGNNVAAFEFISNKYPDYKIRARHDELYRLACRVGSIKVVRYMCAAWGDFYDYSLVDHDDQDIIPLIKDSIEYLIHMNEIDKIFHKLKKQKTCVTGRNECSICYENSNVITKCHHQYCIDCISKWFVKNNSCPVCRQKFQLRQCLRLRSNHLVGSTTTPTDRDVIPSV